MQCCSHPRTCAYEQEGAGTGHPQQQALTIITDPMQLPAPCRELVLQYLDTHTKANLRLICRNARQAVHDATSSLAWTSFFGQADKLTRLPDWLQQCRQLQHLTCNEALHLSDLHGLPSGLRSLDLSTCHILTDLSPLLACTGLQELVLGGPFDRYYELQDQSTVSCLLAQLATRDRCSETDAQLVASCGQEPATAAPNPSADAAASTSTAATTTTPTTTNAPTDTTATASTDKNSTDVPWALSVSSVLPHLTALTRLQLTTALQSSHSPAAGQLAHAIGACTSLRTLQLRIRGFEHMAPHLGVALPHLQHLTLLDLEVTPSNHTPLSVGWLAVSLPHLTALHTLVYMHVMNQSGLPTLAPALQGLTRLQRLDLRGTGVRRSDVEALVPRAAASATRGCQASRTSAAGAAGAAGAASGSMQGAAGAASGSGAGQPAAGSQAVDDAPPLEVLCDPDYEGYSDYGDDYYDDDDYDIDAYYDAHYEDYGSHSDDGACDHDYPF